jgi:uncharacterized protein
MSRPALLYIDQTQFIDDVRVLAALLKEDDWKPDFIVGIGRGGLVPAAFLSHATGIVLLSIDHSSKVPTFSEELLVKLADKTKAGIRLLIVDDINDSGKTLHYLRQSFLMAGGVATHIRVAVLIDNIRSIESVDYRARTVDRYLEPRWFVFPWEAMADSEDRLVDEAVSHWDSEPEPIDVEPEPIDVEPEPIDVEPEPIDVEPEPIDVEPEPIDVEPEPIDVEPESIDVEPEPIDTASLDEIENQFTKALCALNAMLAEFKPEHGGIGHNRPPLDLEITSMEEAQIVVEEANLVANDMLVEIESPKSDPTKIEKNVSRLSKIGEWFSEKSDKFAEEVFKKAGGLVGIGVVGLIFASWPSIKSLISKVEQTAADWIQAISNAF